MLSLALSFTSTQALVSAACRLLAVSTLTRGPLAIFRSSMKSKQSTSARPAATSGRYQPLGGAGRRIRRTLSCNPRRESTRLIAACEGASAISASKAVLIAPAPYSPSTLSSRRLVRSATMRLLHISRRAVPGAPRLAIREVHAIQPLPLSPLYPPRHRTHARPKLSGYRVHAFASTHPANHLAAHTLNTEFLAMTRPQKKLKTLPELFCER